MANFRFDEQKTYAQNCEAFLEEIKSVDPEMAVILCENWDKLVAIVQEGERNTKARSEFNSSVALALDALATGSHERSGES